MVVLQTTEVSFQEVLFVLLLAVLGLSLSKWKKPLFMIILLETSSLLFLSFLLGFGGGHIFMNILVFTFFVSEALVLLSSYYYMLQWIGVGQGILIFN